MAEEGLWAIERALLLSKLDELQSKVGNLESRNRKLENEKNALASLCGEPSLEVGSKPKSTGNAASAKMHAQFPDQSAGAEKQGFIIDLEEKNLFPTFSSAGERGLTESNSTLLAALPVAPEVSHPVSSNHGVSTVPCDQKKGDLQWCPGKPSQLFQEKDESTGPLPNFTADFSDDDEPFDDLLPEPVSPTVSSVDNTTISATLDRLKVAFGSTSVAEICEDRAPAEEHIAACALKDENLVDQVSSRKPPKRKATRKSTPEKASPVSKRKRTARSDVSKPELQNGSGKETARSSRYPRRKTRLAAKLRDAELDEKESNELVQGTSDKSPEDKMSMSDGNEMHNKTEVSPTQPSSLFTIGPLKMEKGSEEPEQSVEDGVTTSVEPKVDESKKDSSNVRRKRRPCNFCSRTFSRKPTRNAHEASHTGKRPFGCELCSSTFPTKTRLGYHVKRVHPDAPLCVCEICGQSFWTKYGLGDHRKTHPERKTETGQIVYHCGQCSVTFAEYAELVKHRETHIIRYHCGVCNKVFKRKEDKVSHEATHRDEKPFACQLCESAFTSGSRLGDHVTRVHPDAPPCVCESCGKSFRTKYSLGGHMKIHIDEKAENGAEGKVYACRKCSATFSEARSLRRHWEAHKYVHACAFCDRVFNRKISKERHELDHKGDKPYACECGSSFRTKELKEAHKQAVHSNESNDASFVCSTCNKSFKNKYYLSAHMRLHVLRDTGEISSKKKDTGIHTCRTCHATFTDVRDMDKHRLTHQPGYFCSFCGKKFPKRARFIEHERVHTGEQPFTCDICKSSFRTRHMLYYHEKCVHSDEPPCICETCGKNVKRKSMKAHVLTHTQTDKLFPCEWCSKRYKNARALLVHRRNHTGERPYKCSQCDATFGQQASRDSHVAFVHKNDRRFPCQYCERRFVSPYDLAKHERTHTGEKPYACEFCGDRFAEKGNMRKHQKNKHKDELA